MEMMTVNFEEFCRKGKMLIGIALLVILLLESMAILEVVLMVSSN